MAAVIGWRMNLDLARRRLFGLQLSALIVLLSLLVAGAYGLARRQLFAALDERLVLMARAVAYSLEYEEHGRPEFEEALFLARREDQLPVGSHAAVQWLDLQGHVVLTQGPLTLQSHEPRHEEFYTQSDPLARVYTYMGRSRSGPFGFARVAISLVPLQQQLHELFRSLALAGLATLFLAGIVSWWWTRRVLRPVQAAYEELSGFSAAVAHELRTPLTALRLNSESLVKRLDTYDREQLRQVAEELNAAAEDLAETVDSILILARRADALKDADLSAVDLRSVVAEVVHEFRSTPERIVVLDSPSVLVLCNDSHLRIMLRNLLQNAIRYTDGPVTVRWSQGADHANLAVSDTGPGLSAEECSKIFEPFWRGERSRARHLGGSGLGLSIVRALAQLQGGSVSVSSRPGEGSVFRLRLPTC